MKIPKKIVSLIATGVIVVNSVPAYVSADSAMEKESLVGNDRFDTSVKISKSIKDKKNVVIVNDKTMVDALSVSTLAKKMNASILLASGKKLDNGVKEEIKNIAPKNVFIIGGEKAISKEIENEIKEMKLTTSRVAGKDRYETAIKIAQMLGDKDEAIVVNGEKGLADAVSIASVAAQYDMPIILTKEDKLENTTKEYLNKNNFEKVYVIGGEKVISKKVENELSSSERIAGDNRNDTNANIISKFYKETELENLYIAKDGMKKTNELIDALSISTLAAQNKAPILLAGKKLSKGQLRVVNSKKLKRVTQVGGNGNENVYKNIIDIQKVDTYTVTSEDELKNILEKVNANDIVNIQLSDKFTSNIRIETYKNVSMNLSGSTNKLIEIDAPNATLSNSGNLEKLTLINIAKGSLSNLGEIKSLEVKKDVKNYTIKNDGKIGSLSCDKNNVNIDNKGTIDKINGSSQSLGGGDISIDQVKPPELDNIEVESLSVIDDNKFEISMVDEKEYKFKVYVNNKEVKVVDIRENEDFPSYVISINSTLKDNDKLKIVVMANGAKDCIKEITINEKDFELVKEFKYNTNYKKIENDRYNNKSTINIQFNKEINLIDKQRNKEVYEIDKIPSRNDRIRLYKLENGKEEYIKTNVGKDSYCRWNEMDLNLEETLEKGSYILKLTDLEIQDVRENVFKSNIRFTVSEGKVVVNNFDELKKAIEDNNKEIEIKNNITLNENLLIPESVRVIVPENIKLNMNKKDIDLQGEIVGKGSIDRTGEIKISKQGMLFEPKVEHIEIDKQSGLKISNVSMDRVESINIEEAWVRRDSFGHMVSITTSRDYGVKAEIKEIGSSSIILKTETNEIKENYNVIMRTGNNREDYRLIKIDKPITLKINKKELKEELENITNTYNNISEGNKTGQYIVGTKSKVKEIIDKLEALYDNATSQKEIDETLYKEMEKIDTILRENLIPEKASSASEINKLLKTEDRVQLAKNITLDANINIPEYKKLIIPEGITLNTNKKSVQVNGTIQNKGTIIDNKNDIKIGNTGLLDEPQIKNTKVNGKNAVAIFNIGKDRINSFYIAGTEYSIEGNEIIKTTNYSKTDMKIDSEDKIQESDRVPNGKYNTAGIYISGFKVEESAFEKNKTFKLLYDGNKKSDIDLNGIVCSVNKEYLQKRLNELKYINEYIKEDQLIFHDVDKGNEIKGKIGATIEKADSILKSQNVNQKEIDNADDEIRVLLQEIWYYSDYKIISTIDDLKTRIDLVSKNPNQDYRGKIEINQTIEISSDLEIPENIILYMERDGKLDISGGKLTVNGLIYAYIERSASDVILNSNNENLVIGEKGFVVKPEISIIKGNEDDIINVYNVGKEEARIYIDDIAFLRRNDGVYYTTRDNINGVVIKDEYISDNTASLNIKPSLAFSAKAEVTIPKAKISVSGSNVLEVDLKAVENTNK